MTKRRSSGGLRTSRLLGYGLTTMLLWVACGSNVRAAPQTGGGQTQQPRFVDKQASERKSRSVCEPNGSTKRGRPASCPASSTWSLRLAGVEKTRQALALQRDPTGTG